jgi:hypothetical protein
MGVWAQFAICKGFEASSDGPIAEAEYECTERTVSLELKIYILPL